MKTSEETKQNSILVRTIEAAVGVKFPDELEQQFRDSCCRAGLAALPALEIGHIVRLHEALCAVEHASIAEKELRAGLMAALGRHHNLRAFRSARAGGRK